ncbi:MAG: hypothetical protein DMG14_29945 [Acidobacteria bacterium]|nr:MAG: hypothetical protein DMG14_29945 [Acidobacteriota bacterium]
MRLMKLLYVALLALLITPCLLSAAEDPYAAQLFKQNCASCHEVAAAAPGARIPPVSALKAMTPTAILRALESGIMKSQAAVLSANERQAVANFLGTAITVERSRDEITNPCPAGAGWKDGPSWSNWGAGLTNIRFQAAKEAGLKAGEMGLRVSGHRGSAVATGCVPRASIHRKSGRQRLCAGCGNGLCALDHNRTGRSAVGDYCCRSRREAGAVLRRFLGLLVRIGWRDGKATVETETG